MTVPVTAVLAALLGLLLVGLSARISQLRMRHKISLGDGGNTALQRAIRAHGNATEHAPIYLLMSLAYEIAAGTDAFVLGAGVVFGVSRVLHAAGLLGRGLHVARMVGAGLTNLAQVALGAGLLFAVAG